MKKAAGLLLLSYSSVALAQTQWVTATISGDVVSWIWSITPGSTLASSTSAPSSATTPPTTVTATQTLVLLPGVTGISTTPVFTNLPTSSIASTNPPSSTSSLSSSPTPATSPSPIPSSSSLSQSSSTTAQSSSIASFTPNPTSSAAGLTLSQATALPSSSAATDTSGTASPTARASNNNTLIKIILGVVLSILAVLILAILLFLCLRRRRRRREAVGGTRTPHNQEKNWTGSTEYLPHGEPTLPMLRATHPSNSQLYMPAPTAAVGAYRSRNYSSNALSPLEPDISRNPFMASSERLNAFRAPEPARGAYQPIDTRFPPSRAQHPYYDPTMSELPAAKMSTEYRPMPISMPSSALTSHQNSNISNNYTSDDSGTSSNDHGDIGLVAHNAMHRHEPTTSASPHQRAMQYTYPEMSQKRPYATRPPSVITDRPYLPRKSSQRPSNDHSSPQGFDFGFGRPGSSSATRYRKSPAMSVREHEAEQTPMITPPSHDEDEEEEEEERDAFGDEAGTGGMVPLGFSPRSPSVSGGSGLVRGIRRDSLGLGDRLGSLKRTGSIRRSSLGSGKRFSIARRPIGGQ